MFVGHLRLCVFRRNSCLCCPPLLFPSPPLALFMLLSSPLPLFLSLQPFPLSIIVVLRSRLLVLIHPRSLDLIVLAPSQLPIQLVKLRKLARR